MIKVSYYSIDGYRKTAQFKTLKGAQRFAQLRVGKFPEIGRSYAISDDDVGKIVVSGAATLRDLFPRREV